MGAVTSIRHCLECGARSDVVFVSSSRTCRRCAKEIAVAHIDRAFDSAEALQGMPEGSIRQGIERASAQITQEFNEAAAAREERKARRKVMAKAVRGK